jgi:hypothetical protein
MKLVALTAQSILLVFTTGNVMGQAICLTDTTGAHIQQQIIEAQFADPDPVWRRELGLPEAIQAITLVDENRACAAALEGLRAQGRNLRSSTSSHVYLFRVDPGLYAAAGDADLNAITFFNHQWQYITTLAGLH